MPQDQMNAPQPAPEDLAFERLWHLHRGLRFAFFIAFIILVFGLSYHPAKYDIYLDASLGRAVADGGLAALKTPPALELDAPSSGWLWWVVSYALVSFSGPGAVVLLSSVLSTAGFALAFVTLSRRLSMPAAGLLLIVAAYLARPYMAVGAHGAGLFVFAALFALLTTRLNSRTRGYWWAVGLMLLYVNLEISWPAGAALCTGFLLVVISSKVLGRGRKALALVAALAATLANPDFLHAWRTLWRLPLDPDSAVAWLSRTTSAAVYAKGVSLGLLALGVILTLVSGSRHARALALAALLVVLSGLGVANFPAFALCTMVCIALSVSVLAAGIPVLVKSPTGAFFGRWVSPFLRADASVADTAAGAFEARLDMGLSSVACGVALLVVLGLFSATVSGSMVYVPAWHADYSAVPAKAVAFIDEHDLSGVALVHPAWAGFLMWEDGSGMIPVADSRPVWHSGPAQDAAAWAFRPSASGSAPEVMRRLEEWKTAFVLVPQEWPKALAFRDGWTPVYWDDVSAVIVPDTPENAALIAASDQSLTYPPFFNRTGSSDYIDSLEKALTAKLEAQGELAYARYGLATCKFIRKDYAQAEALLILALAAKDDLAPAWLMRADIHRRGGDDAGAIEFYSQALEYQGDLAMAYLQLGNLVIKRGNFVAGLKLLRSAQAADDAKPQLDLIRPGLRRELDSHVKMLANPAAAPPPVSSAPPESTEPPAAPADL